MKAALLNYCCNYCINDLITAKRQSMIERRNALVALCLVLESRRFRWELRVGFVGLRGLGRV
jgi:hypothetical protein